MRQIINNTPSGSGLGDTLYVATGKINAMTLEIYTILGTISGSLTKTNTSEFINDGEDGTHPFLSTSSSIAISSVTGLQTALGSLQASINSVSSSVLQNSTDISTLQSDNNTTNDSITSILGALTAQQNLITGIQGDIADIYNIINP
jgi:hypothetical protein